MLHCCCSLSLLSLSLSLLSLFLVSLCVAFGCSTFRNALIKGGSKKADLMTRQENRTQTLNCLHESSQKLAFLKGENRAEWCPHFFKKTYLPSPTTLALYICYFWVSHSDHTSKRQPLYKTEVIVLWLATFFTRRSSPPPWSSLPKKTPFSIPQKSKHQAERKGIVQDWKSDQSQSRKFITSLARQNSC